MTGKVRLRLSLLVLGLTIFLSEVKGYEHDSSFDGCLSAKIPCGGNTRASCTRYCRSVGFSQGSCDGYCCVCSEDAPAEAHFPIRGNNNNYGGATNHSSTSTSFFNLGGSFTPVQRNSRRVDYSKPTWKFNNTKTFTSIPNLPKKPSHLPTYPNPNLNVVHNEQNNVKGVCSSVACQEEAYRVQSQMNERVDPCDDFYEFACGGFNRQSTMSQDEVEVTPFSLVKNKVRVQLWNLFEEQVSSAEPKSFVLVKNMYRSCMNTGVLEQLGFSPLLKALDDVGGWPVLYGGAWQPLPEFTWDNFVIWFKELGFSMDYFMKISIEKDLRQTTKRYITIGEPPLALSDQVLVRGLNEPVVNSYFNYMVEMATLMGANRVDAKRDMLEVANFEVNLAKCFYRHDNSRSGHFYNPLTIHQMQFKYPNVQWLQFFRRIFPSSVSITGQETIQASVPYYMDCFFKLVERTEARTVANYGIWRAVAASVTLLHNQARSLQLNFYSAITGQKSRQPRWKECTDMVTNNMGNAVGAMYVRRYFDDKSKSHATEMVQDIQRGFLDILNEASWMDSFTKQQAREKALAMLVHIGYPEEHKSDAKISSLYAQYDFKPNELFGNVRSLVTGTTTRLFGELRTQAKRNDWTIHGKNAVVNAFYLPLENAIQFPAAILQGHFFNSTRPKYLNYGAIGWIIGHEISHGFDDQGHQYDKFGNHKNWWDPYTKDTYNRKKECIIEQYFNYESKIAGLRVNGERSQGENIADSSGIKQAYRGYQYWQKRNGGHTVEKSLPGMNYTPNQMFWIAAAQNWCAVQRLENVKHNLVAGVHSPPEFRVRGAFANSFEFSQDFQCSPGSRMNPVQKCVIW